MPEIDFQQVRSQITIEQVLDLLGFIPTARVGVRLRGPCPIHGSRLARSRSQPEHSRGSQGSLPTPRHPDPLARLASADFHVGILLAQF